MRPAGLVGVVPALGARCSASRRRARLRATAPFHAGGRGSQSETLAQRAGESRRGGEENVEQSEPSAGEEGSGPLSAGGVFAKPRPARKGPFQRLDFAPSMPPPVSRARIDAPPRAGVFSGSRGRRNRIGPWPEHNPRRRFVTLICAASAVLVLGNRMSDNMRIIGHDSELPEIRECHLQFIGGLPRKMRSRRRILAVHEWTGFAVHCWTLIPTPASAGRAASAASINCDKTRSRRRSGSSTAARHSELVRISRASR